MYEAALPIANENLTEEGSNFVNEKERQSRSLIDHLFPRLFKGIFIIHNNSADLMRNRVRRIGRVVVNVIVMTIVSGTPLARKCKVSKRYGWNFNSVSKFRRVPLLVTKVWLVGAPKFDKVMRLLVANSVLPKVLPFP